ncbi:hypothetical protein C8F01DRAFT_1088001 [Mycena amicta]|nr:hypothetical protein C8F01DRAFT_1088001 [Mycena amicta]
MSCRPLDQLVFYFATLSHWCFCSSTTASLFDATQYVLGASGQLKTILLFFSIVYRLCTYIKLSHSPTVADELLPLPKNVVEFLVQILFSTNSIEPQTQINGLWELARRQLLDGWDGLLLRAEVNECLRESGPMHDLVSFCCWVGNALLPVPVYALWMSVQRKTLGLQNVTLPNVASSRFNAVFSLHTMSLSTVLVAACNIIMPTCVSTTNLAWSYNLDLGNTDVMMNTTLLAHILQKAVMDSVFMHALLRRARRYNVKLELPHNGDQDC